MRISRSRTLVRSLRRSLVLGLCLAATSCTLFLGGPEAPGPAVIPDPDPGAVQKAWNAALSQGAGDSIIVILNEAQLTAYLRSRLSALPNSRLQSAQVFLRDGRIMVYGVLQTDGLAASALVSLVPRISDQGLLALEFEKVQVGQILLPSDALQVLSESLSEALTGEITSLATGFQLQEVLAADGQLAIRGRVR